MFHFGADEWTSRSVAIEVSFWRYQHFHTLVPVYMIVCISLPPHRTGIFSTTEPLI